MDSTASKPIIFEEWTAQAIELLNSIEDSLGVSVPEY